MHYCNELWMRVHLTCTSKSDRPLWFESMAI